MSVRPLLANERKEFMLEEIPDEFISQEILTRLREVKEDRAAINKLGIYRTIADGIREEHPEMYNQAVMNSLRRNRQTRNRNLEGRRRLLGIAAQSVSRAEGAFGRLAAAEDDVSAFQGQYPDMYQAALRAAPAPKPVPRLKDPRAHIFSPEELRRRMRVQRELGAEEAGENCNDIREQNARLQRELIQLRRESTQCSANLLGSDNRRAEVEGERNLCRTTLAREREDTAAAIARGIAAARQRVIPQLVPRGFGFGKKAVRPVQGPLTLEQAELAAINEEIRANQKPWYKFWGGSKTSKRKSSVRKQKRSMQIRRKTCRNKRRTE